MTRAGRPRKPKGQHAIGVHTTVPLAVLFRIRAEARRKKKRVADVIRQRLRHAAPEWFAEKEDLPLDGPDESR